MIIKSTRNTVAAAVVFSVLSGVSTIGHTVLEEVDVQSVRVSYADLNLSNNEDLQTLYQRLNGAAQRVCGQVTDKVARHIRENRECRDSAVEQAMRQVGNESLAAIHHQ